MGVKAAVMAAAAEGQELGADPEAEGCTHHRGRVAAEQRRVS